MNRSIEMIATIAQGLQELKDQVVFVGGAVTSLYLNSENGPEIRPTEDVDCIVEITTRSEHVRLSERLLEINFTPDTSPDAPICRYQYLKIKVDIMPTDENIMEAIRSHNPYPEIPNSIDNIINCLST